MSPFLLVLGVPGVVVLASCAGCSEPETAAPAPTTAGAPAVPPKTKGNRGRPPKEAFGASGSPALGSRPSLEVRDDL